MQNFDKKMFFKDLVKERRTWRKFNNKKISDDIINDILENSLYCPSSFGLEPWKVIVISNDELKAKIKPLCDNQEPVTQASHLFIILSYKGFMFKSDNPWMINRSKTKLHIDSDEKFLKFYNTKFMRYVKQINDWDQWSIRQSYILLENILLSATAYDLGTCPMEGIDINAIMNFLETENIINEQEKGKFNCPYVISIGYKSEEYIPRKKSLSEYKDDFIFIK